MRTKYRQITMTPVLDTAILATGDIAGLPVETGVIGEPGEIVYLDSVQVLDGDDQNLAFDLLISDLTLASLGTINGVINLSDADSARIQAHVVFAASTMDLINSRLFRQAVGQTVKLSKTGTLFVSVISRGAPTYTASGMVVTLCFK